MLKDFLENEVEDKYYLSEKIQNRFKQEKEDDGTNNIIGTTAPDFRTIGQRDIVFGHNANEVGALVATDYKQPKQIVDNIKFKEGKIILRKLTPKEGFRLMGLHDVDIEKIQNTGISDTSMYKLAGNSIVINVLNGIHTKLFK